jgi:hypothetical protein
MGGSISSKILVDHRANTKDRGERERTEHSMRPSWIGLRFWQAEKRALGAGEMLKD